MSHQDSDSSRGRNNDTFDRVSRRTVLRTSALASTLSIVGGLSVGTVSATNQEKETFLERFAGESPLLVTRGDVVEIEGSSTMALLPDARIRRPEGILIFVPQRLAEDGQVRFEDMLVMSGVRALEGDLTTAMAGVNAPGHYWFPSGTFQQLGENEWFSTNVVVAEDELRATRVITFRDEEWGVNDPMYPRKWAQGDDPMLGSLIASWDWRNQVVEAGVSLEELAAEGGLLFGAAGHNFFPTDRRGDFSAAWEELADAETATVLSPDDLRA